MCEEVCCVMEGGREVSSGWKRLGKAVKRLPRAPNCSKKSASGRQRMITNLKPYPAYKDSCVEWLGHVPEHLRCCRAGAWYDPAGVRWAMRSTSTATYSPRPCTLEESRHLLAVERAEGWRRFWGITM